MGRLTCPHGVQRGGQVARGVRPLVQAPVCIEGGPDHRVVRTVQGQLLWDIHRPPWGHVEGPAHGLELPCGCRAGGHVPRCGQQGRGVAERAEAPLPLCVLVVVENAGGGRLVPISVLLLWEAAVRC